MRKAISEIKDVIATNSDKMANALSNGDAAELSTVFSEDAFMKFPGMAPLEGRKSIEKAHQQMMKQGISKLNLQSREVESFGDFAYEVGDYELFAGEDMKVDFGSYLTVWKQNGSDWEIFRDVISSAKSQES